MHIPFPSGPLVAAFALAACSDPESTTLGDNVDVGAAASRAQSDIANYAAAPTGDVGRPVPRAARNGPVPAVKAIALADDAPPDVVVRRYVAALAGRQYDEAWSLWDRGGAASGMTRAAFAASQAHYASYRATVGPAGDVDAEAGQRFVTVPVIVTGRLRSGAPFRLEGPVILHKVADGIDSENPHAHAWRIRNSEVRPRPTTDGTSASDAPK